MLRITLKALLANKRRVVATSLSVVVGVAFVTGSLILTDTIQRTLDNLLTEELATTDVVIRGTADPDEPGSRRSVSPIVVDQARELPDVRAAVGALQRPVELGDESNQEESAFGPPTFATTWIDDSELSNFRIAEGAPPSNDNEMAVDRETARNEGFQVGETVTVSGPDDARSLRVSGIATFGDADTRAGARYILMQPEPLQDLVEVDAFDYVAIAGQPDTTPENLRTSIETTLRDSDTAGGFDPRFYEVVEGETVVEENREQLAQGFQVFGNFLLVFAGIALFVAAFIVHNTFSILLAQRTSETALLRALGAKRKQLVRSTLVEAGAVGLVASVLGLVAGVAGVVVLKEVIGALGISLPASGVALDMPIVAVAVVTGVVATVVPSLVPAIRGSRVSPLAAIRDVEAEVRTAAPKRTLFGIVTGATGALVTIVGFVASGMLESVAAVVGLVLVFVGAYALAPSFARPLTKAISTPLIALRGNPVRMARDNAMRNPARTAATASALMIGVTLITFMSIFAESAKVSIENSVDRSFPGDFVVRGPSAAEQLVSQGNTLPSDVAGALETLPEVEIATSLQRVDATVFSDEEQVSIVDPEPFAAIFDAKLLSGELQDLGTTGIAIDDGVAERRGVELGDAIEVEFVEDDVRRLDVVAVYDAQSTLGDLTVSQALVPPGSSPTNDAIVMVNKSPEVGVEDASNAINSAIRAFPGAVAVDITAFKEQLTRLIDQVLNVFLVLLAMAVVVALFGITNTLALSVAERTREIGLLRAVGMKRAQIRSTVRWEAVIIAIQGTVTGIVVGTAIAVTLVAILSTSGVDTFAVPLGRLVILVLLAAIAGVTAGFLPARKAANLDILRAITPT